MNRGNADDSFVCSKNQVSKLTCSNYFPVSAFVDLYIVFQVNLDPATVSLVVESDLLKQTAAFKGGQTIFIKGVFLLPTQIAKQKITCQALS